jgi:DNA ligase-1
LTLDSSKKLLMTATLWDNAKNPTDWWMTEKYDGMRLYWNGTQFLTRQGNKVNAPDFITKQLPNVPLDGELW